MEFEYFIENGEVTITGHKNNFIRELVIPDFINGCKVTTINPDSFIHFYILETIIIPTSVKNISSDAFGNLHNVKINNTKIIGHHIINNKFVIGGYNLLTIINQINNGYIVKSDHYYHY